MVDLECLKAHVFDVVGALRAVRDELGPGLNEYCYQEGFAIELERLGIPFEREKTFHPTYKGVAMSAAYRLDFLCKGDIVVECKAVPELNATLRAQLFNYMRLLKTPCGIIVNFYPKFYKLERYFFGSETRELLTVEGNPLW
jgi:GxxExxY protein